MSVLMGVVARVACGGCRGGGDAVVLDGLRMRPGADRSGTSSWAHPCSWTQRQLSIKVTDHVWTVPSVSESGKGCMHSDSGAQGMNGNSWDYRKISLLFKQVNTVHTRKKTTIEIYGSNTCQCCIRHCSQHLKRNGCFPFKPQGAAFVILLSVGHRCSYCWTLTLTWLECKRCMACIFVPC